MNNSSPLYGFKLPTDSRLDMVKKAVAVFSVLESLKHGRVKIRKKLIDVLAFYVLNGYNNDTKRMIYETLGLSTDNLTQINSELTKNGYLIRDANNFRKKYLHPDLQRLRDTFMSSDISCKRAIIIRFDE